MKRRLCFLLSMVVIASAMFVLDGCSKLAGDGGTGKLTVYVYDPSEDKEISVYPYDHDMDMEPIASETIKHGKGRTVSFTLISGNYVVYCGAVNSANDQAVQVQAGEEVTIYFDK